MAAISVRVDSIPESDSAGATDLRDCYDCDHAYLSQWQWYVIGEGHYADKRPMFTSAHAVMLGESSRDIVTMQRVVMQHRTGSLKSRVYHRNRNQLDNRFENLTGKRSEILGKIEESASAESYGGHDKR